MVTLFHDFTDPASAVAVARLQRLADGGTPVTFAGFEAVGVDADLPVPLQVLATIEQLGEAAQREGLVLRRPASQPPTGWAHVLGAVAEEHGLGARWRARCYRAYWRDGADIGAPAALVDLAVDAGLARSVARAAVRDRRALAAFRRTVAAHRRQGVGGVPVLRAHGTLVPGLLPEADLHALAGS